MQLCYQSILPCFVMQVRKLGVLKMLLFQIFIGFGAFSLTFGVGQGFICAKYDWVRWNFPFCNFFRYFYAFIYPRNLLSRKTVNTEYLNQIPNPEPRIPNRSEGTNLLMQFFYIQNRKMCLSKKYQYFVVFLPCLVWFYL